MLHYVVGEIVLQALVVARKCASGEALGFKVAQMLQVVKVKDMQISGDVQRGFTRRKRIGCKGVKLRFVDSTQHHGTHIRRSSLPTDLLTKLDSGMYMNLSAVRKGLFLGAQK